MKTVRLTAIEDSMGAKPRTNGDTCSIPKSSPKDLSFTKNVWREYGLGMFANHVTSRGRGTVPFSGRGSSQKSSNTVGRRHFRQLKGQAI